MRKKPRFHSLKKLKIRQDWSRWTLYNLSRLNPPNLATKTYFQQKWTAKSDTRAYHGEQIREKQWKRMFRRNLPAVVPMDHKYLARYDGSEQAAGRGAGADAMEKTKTPPMTPYMQMTYYPVERRLDTAVFRALFASSVRQARQFVVHGLVKVNGKKMIYPGYMLNPGDMFQVVPESVMMATGAQKTRSSVARRIAKEKGTAYAESRKGQGRSKTASVKVPLLADALASTPEAQTPVAEEKEPSPEELKKHLQTLMDNVEGVLAEEVKAKDKQKLREFKQTVRKAISLWRTSTPSQISTLDSQFSFLKSHLTSSKSAQSDSASGPEVRLTREEELKLSRAFDRLKEQAEFDANWNKRDPSKPYLTPWRPRDYMSAFAFIPRYLEVNQNICAAVYLRHPVARPGLAEVPTPFPLETGQLAFNWYLRRR
ncbi:alpha-L RNA-binding motif-containing protein [Lindgomyces ingoldianus]|uniref:Alpha-L RNA-binding motif-containing protein n=1 Tax=Lindgomyces ingoldianus TaxID=673940 RepID=A0ACB6QJW1_9PLEO|nr:alpha-L RNA-binding motif-containing protein [Lindgomyces ingoldianus]KAF2467299.1 alpha-L RNA-binding motif-containing protein [Lindgomyces ingoldianus]